LSFVLKFLTLKDIIRILIAVSKRGKTEINQKTACLMLYHSGHVSHRILPNLQPAEQQDASAIVKFALLNATAQQQRQYTVQIMYHITVRTEFALFLTYSIAIAIILRSIAN
jgi:hypothetical protein